MESHLDMTMALMEIQHPDPTLLSSNDHLARAQVHAIIALVQAVTAFGDDMRDRLDTTSADIRALDFSLANKRG